MNNIPTNEKLFNYLLGELGETERDAIEDRLFADDDFAVDLDDAENDLIDAYVRGKLSASQRRRFETFFLISERRREKLAAATVLIPELFDKKEVRPLFTAPEKISFAESLAAFFRVPAFGWAVGTLAVATLFIGGVWFSLPREENELVGQTDKNANRLAPFLPSPTPQNLNQTNVNLSVSNKPNATNEGGNSNRNLNPTNESGNSNRNLNPTKTATPKTKPETPTPQPESPKPLEVPKPTIATILLVPIVRNGELPKLRIAPETKFARLQIANQERETYQTLRIEVINPDGAMIFRQDFRGAKNPKSLTMQIPSGKLIKGNYEITLSGAKDGENFEDLNYYRFSVDRQTPSNPQ